MKCTVDRCRNLRGVRRFPAREHVPVRANHVHGAGGCVEHGEEPARVIVCEVPRLIGVRVRTQGEQPERQLPLIAAQLRAPRTQRESIRLR